MKIICVGLLLIVSVAFAALPTFPNDWTANEADTILLIQGDYSQGGNGYCCAIQSNCQVQTEFQNGMNYFDYTHNRTRFDDMIANQVIVSFFGDIQKECLVVNGTCQEYCPLEGEVLEPGFLDPNSTDLGPQNCTAAGGQCELYEWKETAFGIIVMEICDVTVNQTDPNNAIPVREIDTLTPFGQFIGYGTSNWNNFVPGTPDPSLFQVKGIDTCPQSPNCDDSARNMNRIRYKLWKTFAKYNKRNSDVVVL